MMKNQPKFLLVLALVLSIAACTNQKNEATTIHSTKSKLNPEMTEYLKSIENDFATIPDERKKDLIKLASEIKRKVENHEKTQLIFICTHNSRRSHMSQLWAQTAAYYYQVPDIYSFSGGTEATAFNYRSVRALKKAGFKIETTDTSENPLYEVSYASDAPLIKGFSKKYMHKDNPQNDFIAVMTCSHADEACPIVLGADTRFSIPYEDPKIADNTPEEEAKYDERCKQIATEMFYIFYKVNV